MLILNPLAATADGATGVLLGSPGGSYGLCRKKGRKCDKDRYNFFTPGVGQADGAAALHIFGAESSHFSRKDLVLSPGSSSSIHWNPEGKDSGPSEGSHTCHSERSEESPVASKSQIVSRYLTTKNYKHYDQKRTVCSTRDRGAGAPVGGRNCGQRSQLWRWLERSELER